jgi:hypothetical protein
MSLTSSSLVYVDAEGDRYLVKDVSAAGDCALLSLLCNPNFRAPLTTSDELRHAVVSFATGVQREDCFTVYSMVGDRTNVHFETYLQHMLRPGFWVGTVFYIWASMAYGCNIRTHFFNEFREPQQELTENFLKKYLNRYVPVDENQQMINIFFHQYKNMLRCKPSMYNHYAALLRLESLDGELSILNVMLNQEGMPWGKKMKK